MEKTTTPLSERLRWKWSLDEPGTRAARATQATLGFYLLLLGSLTALLDTVVAPRPHAGIVLGTCFAGFALAVLVLVRYDRLGYRDWQAIALSAGSLIAISTVLDPRGWTLALLLYFFFVGFVAYFFRPREFCVQLVPVLAGIGGAASQANSLADAADWVIVGITLIAIGGTLIAGKTALVRAFGDLRAHAWRQQRTAELGEVALVEPDLSRLMERAVQLVGDTLHADDATVLERMPSNQGLIIRASYLPLDENDSTMVPGGSGSFASYTMTMGEPVVSEDLASETRFTPTSQLLGSGITSAANVVIPGRDGPFGVLGVRSKAHRRFDENELVFLQAVANIIGAAVRNRATEQTLARTESGASVLADRLQALIEASPLATVELDLSGRVKLWNSAAERTFGWTRQELLGTPYPLVPADARAEYERLLDTLDSQPGGTRIEADRMHKNGARVLCEVHGAALRNSAGEVTGYIALIADISERVRTERELARSQELYQTVVENSRDLIAVIDPDGDYVYCSPSYGTVLGLDPEALVGTSPSAHVHPDDLERVDAATAQAATGASVTVEVRVRRADDEWASVEGTMTGLLDEHGRLQSVLATSRDLSERRAAEEELTKAELRYQTLVEQLPLVTYVHSPDAHGPWSYFSPQLAAILGYDESEWRGDTGFYERILAPQDRARVLATRAASTGRLSLEYRLVAADGRVIWVRDEAMLVRDVAGRPLYVQGYMLDTTAEREADQRRKALEAQLLQSQKMEAVGRLAGGIAHDFNNLLTAITGYSELVLRELPAASEPAQDIEQIRRAAGQAASMTRQLLAFSRRQVLQPTVLSLNEVIEGMESMLKRLIGENIELVTDCDPELLATRSDLSQIEQVVLNLSVNARDAMPQGGRLELRTANVDLDGEQAHAAAIEPGPHVLLEVRDTGSGMDPDTLEHAFEPFFTTKEQGKGTGLGLATVHGIVQQSGGSVVVESELGQGTTFRIYLPAVREAPAVEEPLAEQPARGREMILLVEDEAIVRELLARVLRAQGYTVVEAADGEGALAIAEGLDAIDLLLTDVVMPGLSGRELSERLAAERPQLRILFMSGYTDEAIVHHGVRAGEAEFIAKPFTPDALARKVRAVLDAVLERV